MSPTPPTEPAAQLERAALFLERALRWMSVTGVAQAGLCALIFFGALYSTFTGELGLEPVQVWITLGTLLFLTLEGIALVFIAKLLEHGVTALRELEHLGRAHAALIVTIVLAVMHVPISLISCLHLYPWGAIGVFGVRAALTAWPALIDEELVGWMEETGRR